MRRIIGATLAGLLVGSTVIWADPPGQRKGKKTAQQQRAPGSEGNSGVAVQVAFVSGDVTILRNHYAPRYRNLPPGLQKKVARGGSLPPGWQKKFEPFPSVLERRLSPLPSGYRRGVLEGHAVIFNSRTNIIVDFAVLF